MIVKIIYREFWQDLCQKVTAKQKIESKYWQSKQ